MSGDPYLCCCGHPMQAHEFVRREEMYDGLGPCKRLGCDCPHWAGRYSDDHLRRTPRVAIDLHGPRKPL